MLKPDNNWSWYFDENRDRMAVKSSEKIIFYSNYSAKMLVINNISADVYFSIEDIALFYQFSEAATCLSLTEEQQYELVLNAVIVNRFLKPVMPKSWYFVQQAHAIIPRQSQIVSVSVQNQRQPALFMVVEVGEVASLCVLAQSNLLLADNKKMLLGESIKIMHDRLLPVEIQNSFSFAEAV